MKRKRNSEGKIGERDSIDEDSDNKPNSGHNVKPVRNLFRSQAMKVKGGRGRREKE